MGHIELEEIVDDSQLGSGKVDSDENQIQEKGNQLYSIKGDPALVHWVRKSISHGILSTDDVKSEFRKAPRGESIFIR